MKFSCEVKEVKSKKLASLDIEYRVVLTTLDPAVLALGALDGETLLDVEVTPQGEL